MNTRVSIALSGGCSWLASSAIAFACSFSGPETPFDLIPGLQQRSGFNAPDAGLALPEVPRNVALLNPPLRLLDGQRGVVVDDAQVALDATPALSLSPAQVLHRAQSPLPIGGVLAADPFSPPVAVIGETIDTTPPSAPTILDADLRLAQDPSGCGAQDSCGDITSLSLRVTPAVDDHTPSASLYYAVFIGETRPQIERLTAPTQVVFLSQGGVLLFPPSVREDFPLAVSIAAIDFAGNLGPRSELFVAHTGESGCAIAQIQRTQIAGWAAVGLALAVLWWRRRRVARWEASGS